MFLKSKNYILLTSNILLIGGIIMFGIYYKMNNKKISIDNDDRSLGTLVLEKINIEDEPELHLKLDVFPSVLEKLKFVRFKIEKTGEVLNKPLNSKRRV